MLAGYNAVALTDFYLALWRDGVTRSSTTLQRNQGTPITNAAAEPAVGPEIAAINGFLSDLAKAFELCLLLLRIIEHLFQLTPLGRQDLLQFAKSFFGLRNSVCIFLG